jgi:hypothetical protein
LGSSAKCARWGNRSGRQLRGRPNAGARHGDSACRHRHSARSFSDAPGKHRDPTGGYCDAEHRIDCARFKLDESGYPGQQHSTFYGESEHDKYSGNEAQRHSMRNVAGHDWDNRFVKPEHGLVWFN